MINPYDNQAITQLLNDGDFLAFTRCHPMNIEQVYQFNIDGKPGDNGMRSVVIKVSIINTGIIAFEPETLINANELTKYSTTDLVLSSGIHGNETAPIELCQQLIKDLFLGQINLCTRILFIFGNPLAINANQRFIKENLNTLFSGAHQKHTNSEDKNAERYRADVIERAISCFFLTSTQLKRQKLHYDLHTAIRGSVYEQFAICPYREGRAPNKGQLSLLLSAGVNTILFSQAATSALGYFSSEQCQADAFTIELGKVQPFGDNNPHQLTVFKRFLKQLISEQNNIKLLPFNNNDFNLFTFKQVIKRSQQDFKLHFSDDVKNFTALKQGKLIASDGKTQYVIEQPLEAVLFPNPNVAIGQRAMVTVIPFTL